MQATLTFHGAARNMLERSLARQSTVRGYYSLLDRYCTGLGHIALLNITKSQIEHTLVEARDQGLAPKSLKNLLQFIRKVLTDRGSAVANCIRVHVPEPDVRAMTRPEAAAITDTLRALGGLEADALLVLLRTGLRLGELLALQPQDWDSDRCALHVQRSVNGATKSGRRRIVDVPDDVMAVLEQVGDGQRLFPLCDRTLRRHMNQACKQAGIPHFRIHDLRHTRVTHLLLAGVPVAYVSEQAGHSSPSYTMRVYGHVAVASRDARREWANA